MRPGINRVEHKHRVSVIRAAERITNKSNWTKCSFPDWCGSRGVVVFVGPKAAGVAEAFVNANRWRPPSSAREVLVMGHDEHPSVPGIGTLSLLHVRIAKAVGCSRSTVLRDSRFSCSVVRIRRVRILASIIHSWEYRWPFHYYPLQTAIQHSRRRMNPSRLIAMVPPAAAAPMPIVVTPAVANGGPCRRRHAIRHPCYYRDTCCHRGSRQCRRHALRRRPCRFRRHPWHRRQVGRQCRHAARRPGQRAQEAPQETLFWSFSLLAKEPPRNSSRPGRWLIGAQNNKP
jgi:hypothetical protein